MKNFNPNNMRRLLIILSLALIPMTGLMARDFYWKGGTGRWNDPSMWELRAAKSVEGLVPSKTDNVFIDNYDSNIIIDNDVEVENLYWRSGKISGNPETKISSYGVIEVRSSVVDEFEGVWVLKTDSRGTINSDIKLKGSVYIDATGEVVLDTPVKTFADFIIIKGDVTVSSLIECNVLVLEGNEAYSILVNDATVRKDHLVIRENPNRKLKINGIKLERVTPRNITGKGELAKGGVYHFCNETDAKLVLKAAKAPVVTKSYVRFFVIWFDQETTEKGTFSSIYPTSGSGAVDSVIVHSSHPHSTDTIIRSFWQVTYHDNADASDLPLAIYEIEGVDNRHYSTDYALGTVYDSVAGVSTPGASDGSIFIKKIGSAPFTYTITGGSSNQDGVFTGLSEGYYNVTVSSDSSTCNKSTVLSNIEVSVRAPLSYDSLFTRRVTCTDDSDGIIRLYASGGSGSYEYRMSFSTDEGYPLYNVWQPSNEYLNLKSGTYEFVIRDAMQHLDSVDCGKISLINPKQLTINQVIRTHVVGCYGPTGAMEIIASGGHPRLQYSIDSGDTWSFSKLFEHLYPKSYKVHVKDSLGCEVNREGYDIISGPVELIIKKVTPQPVTLCYENNNGSIAIMAEGGWGNIEYFIENSTIGTRNNSSGNFLGLPVGKYAVWVKDDNDCETLYADSVEVTGPPKLEITGIDITHITGCYGDVTGSITVNATGGTGILQYSIDGGTSWHSSNVFGPLSAGIYQIRVKDENECTKGDVVEILQPDPISITSESYTNITCHNADDGTVTIEAEGGTAPLTYTITGGASNNTGVFTGLSAGTYKVTVSDANGCAEAISSDFTIINPDVITIDSESYTDVNCFGEVDGTVTIVASGGTAPLTYTITGGASNNTGVFTGLSAGTYSVTVSDINGCPPAISSTFVIIEPAAITIDSESYTDISCFGEVDGTVTIVASGGTAPLTYTITGGASNNTGVFTGLSAGTYSVTVSDINGCPPAISSTFIIIEPAAITIDSESYTDISCFGEVDGTVTIVASGGTAPLTYTITGGASNNIGVFTGLSAGTYSVTVSDINGCPPAVSSSFTIIEPAVITIDSESYTDVSCFGEVDGTVTIVASGGTAPLTYTITGGASNNTGVFTGLSAGTYSVTVSDINGCPPAISSTFVIIEPAAITIDSESYTDISCFGAVDGTVTIVASGGTAPLTYTITGGASNNTGVFTGLSAGTYSVTVSDINGCPPAVSSSFTIIEPAVITIDSESYTDVSCFGEVDGTVTIVASGGTAPLTYTITGGASNNTGVFTGLSAGTYSVTVSDINGCPPAVSSSFTIIEPAVITIDSESFTDIACYNDNNGTVTIVASGGTAPLTYTITGGVSNNTGIFTGLSAGTYSVTVSDINGCPPAISSSFTITNPDEIVITEETFTNITCHGANDGAITFKATGGTPPLIYTITGGDTNSTGEFTGLGEGTYQVTVTDNNGCIKTSAIYTVIDPDPIVITLIDSLYSCGSLPVIEADTTFLPDGDGDIYTSTITHVDFADGAVVQSTADIESIAINMEHSYLRDLTIKLICPNGSSLMFTDEVGGGRYLGKPVRDPGDDDLTPGEGFTYIFTEDSEALYTWANVPEARYTYTDLGGNEHVNKLYVPAGPYKPMGNFSSLVGCPLNGDWTLEVTDNNPVDNGYIFKWYLNFAPSTFPEGYCNGMATVEATGGVGELSYMWSNGNTTNTIQDLCADTYTLTVTDENGCYATHTVVIEDVDIQLTITDTVHVTCSGESTGSVTVEATGGNPPYTYIWEDGTISQTIDGLAAGWYFLTVVDRNLCEHYDSVEIKTLNEITVLFSNIVSPLCHTDNGGSHTGSATATASGGVGSYLYEWSSGEIGQTASNLVAGWNWVTVTDEANCTKIDSVEITEPPLLEITDVSITDVSCNGGTDGKITITIAGGNPPYTIEWYSPEHHLIGIESSLTFRPAGDYTVKVKDANGCTIPDSVITIGEPEILDFDIDVTASACNNPTGSATVINITGGNGGETITWYNSANVNIGTGVSIGSLAVGNYSVKVEDSKGCSETKEFELEDNSDLQIDGFTWLSPVSCYGECDGIAQVNVSGSGAIVSYIWSTGSTTDTETSLCGGSTVSVTVTDENGCTADTTIIVPQPEELQFSDFTITHNQCYGNNDGSITAIVEGGTPTYTFEWRDEDNNILPFTGAVASDLYAGKYFVTVSDINGCQANDSVVINPAVQIVVHVSTTQADCGLSNGTATLTPENGIPPYTYHWPDPIGSVTTSTVGSLGIGIYYVTVEDALGCETVARVEITDVGGMSIVVDVTDATCYNGNDGEATVVSVIGGTGLVTITWEDAFGNIIPGGNTASGLNGGMYYYVTVTDENGCGVVEEIFIGQPAEFVLTVSGILDASCFGYNDGAATISAAGGNGSPYTYLWPDGDTNSSRIDLAAGSYTVTVFDNLGCEQTTDFTIGEPSLIEYELTTTKPSCGQNNGSLTVSNITGGSGSGYVVTWSNDNWSVDSVGFAVTNLVAGIYDLVITDDTGCSVSETITLESDTDMYAEVIDITHVNCAGEVTGSATIGIIGGTAPYTVNWSNGQTGMTISNVAAGTYTATITDANLCVIYFDVNIEENAPLVTDFVFTQPIVCAGDSIASFYVTVTGGVAPYIYHWEDGLGNTIGSDSALVDMTAGTYNITVTDNLGCTTTNSITIASSDPIAVTFVITETDCSASTGSVKANVSGGVAPYNYNWAKYLEPGVVIDGNGTDFIYNLGVGYYTLSLTDALGCVYRDTVLVESTTDMEISVINTVSVTCLGRNDGQAEVTIVNGQSPYTIIWANGDINNTTETSFINTQLYQGNQIVRVIDANGCEQVTSFTVPTGNALYVSLRSYPDVGGDVADFGFVEAGAVGGIPPYSYNWEDAEGNNIGTSYVITNLNYGWYYVTVTDANPNPCQWIDSIEVLNKTISYDTIFINHVTCHGFNDGSISIQGTGGEEPYQYRWRHDSWSTDSIGNTITNLIAGTYYLTLTDKYGFVEITDSIEITQPEPLGLNAILVQKTACSEPTGIVKAELPESTGAIAPITYYWTSSEWQDTIVKVDNPILDSVGIGMYYVTIVDAKGCTDTDTVEMIDNSDMVVRLITFSPRCYGDNDGVIEAIVTDAIGDIIYIWSHDSTLNGPRAENLAPGTYYVTVTDSSTCYRTAEATLTEPALLEFNVIDSVMPICYSDVNGSVTAEIFGGTAPYVFNAYQYSSGISYQESSTEQSDTVTIEGLSGGIYRLQVEDSYGCWSEQKALNLRSVVPYMTVSIDIDNHPSCNNHTDDGQLTANVTAYEHPHIELPTQPNVNDYNFIWNDSITGQTISNIGVGEHTVTVTYKDYGCPVENSIYLFALTNITANPGFRFKGELYDDNSTYCVGDTVELISYYSVHDLDYIDIGCDSITWESVNNIIETYDSTFYTTVSRNNGDNYYYLTVYKDGCYDTDSIKANNFDFADVKVSAYKIDPDLGGFNGNEPLVSIFVGNSALVKIDQEVEGAEYTWSEQLYTTVQGLTQTGSFVLNESKTRAIVTPIDSTFYKVLAKTPAFELSETEMHYCYSKDSVLVRVLGEFNPPNAFSPNGDGFNDTWKMEGFKLFNTVSVKIFNRWGQLVFESSDPNAEWDGTNKKGKDLPVGTYYYIIDYSTDSYSKKISGPITIIR
jgi:gliding motility-associated-like protein